MLFINYFLLLKGRNRALIVQKIFKDYDEQKRYFFSGMFLSNDELIYKSIKDFISFLEKEITFIKKKNEIPKDYYEFLRILDIFEKQKTYISRIKKLIFERNISIDFDFSFLEQPFPSFIHMFPTENARYFQKTIIELENFKNKYVKLLDHFSPHLIK